MSGVFLSVSTSQSLSLLFFKFSSKTVNRSPSSFLPEFRSGGFPPPLTTKKFLTPCLPYIEDFSSF